MEGNTTRSDDRTGGVFFQQLYCAYTLAPAVVTLCNLIVSAVAFSTAYTNLCNGTAIRKAYAS